MQEHNQAAAAAAAAGGALKIDLGNAGSPSDSQFEFANTHNNPQMLQGAAAGGGGGNDPPELAYNKEMHGHNLRRIPPSPFRFANLETLQMQGQGQGQGQGPGGVPLNPPPAPAQGAGAGGVPINPFNFQGGNFESFVPASRLIGKVTNFHYQYLPLSQAICRGDLQAVKRFLHQRPDAINTWMNNFETPLLTACTCGQLEIVKELLRRMAPEQTVTPPRADGLIPYHTPLTVAAGNGNLEIAEALLAKNPKLIEIPGAGNLIPVVRAVWGAKEEMARYLYPLTPLQVLLDFDGYHGTILLLNAIFYGMLDIALDLFEACPRLAVTKHPLIVGSVPTICLASRPDLFRSGCNLGFWGSLIYSLVEVKSPADPGSNQNQSLSSMMLQLLPRWLGINRIYKLKEMHEKAHNLLQGMCEEASKMDTNERWLNGLPDAFFFAAKFGNKEFLVEIIKADPELFWLRQNSTDSNILLLAVEFRQQQIFSLFYGMDERRKILISGVSSLGNGILHIAGLLPPRDKLSSVAGAALQLQRELQWFEEVKSIVPEIDQEKQNGNNAKPLEVFEASHESLRKEAEEWMKNNANSCSLVAALIVTVTFAAVFTIPGGTHSDTGDPLHLQNTRFMVFIVSDLVSFFASCTSVLIFLGILTARYSFEDFLVSLPTKMIAGLSILFISIAAMLVAFSSALFTTLYRTSWLVIPVIVVAFFPALLFVLLQYPLLKEMIISTYGKGIFDREMKRWT